MYVANRVRPLTIAGPPGLTEWYARVMAAEFPGDRKLPFALTLIELEIGKQQEIGCKAAGGLLVTPHRVVHDDLVGPCLAYRVEVEGKTICYSGDTEWIDALHTAARSADLFVCECYMFERPSPTHMNYETLREKLPAIGARRVVLTHMSEAMLERTVDVQEETARDGMVVEF
jgi:ribonuclease BN (tRNA processing enzyme)